MKRWDRTHEAVRRAAMDLFAEKGYDAAATAAIAARAGVSEMTLFRHYPTKEALLLADTFDPLMSDAIRMRPAEEPPLTASARGIRHALTQVDAEEMHALRDRLRIIAETPSLRGAIERNSEDTIVALTAALTGRGENELRARVAATAVIAGLSSALLEWARSEREALGVVLTAALDVLDGG